MVMLTGADHASTIDLFLRVCVPLAAGGWSWGHVEPYADALAREYIYSAKECEDAVHTYGRNMPRVASHGALGERFSICARGPVTGLWVGMREWAWSVSRREYRPVGEYMCGWRSAERAYWEKTGELFSRKRFSARACADAPTVVLNAIPATRAA